MKKLGNIFLKVKDFCVAHIGRKVTPLFLVMLGLSFVLWYVSKLQYSYTAEVPVVVSVEGDRHRVTCVVQGSGHNILSARYFKRKPVKLKRGDVELIPVEGEVTLGRSDKSRCAMLLPFAMPTSRLCR